MNHSWKQEAKEISHNESDGCAGGSDKDILTKLSQTVDSLDNSFSDFRIVTAFWFGFILGLLVVLVWTVGFRVFP